MNAGKAVYGILSANSGVTDIVGTNIFPEIAEQETAVPFIVYQLQSVDPDDTHDGPSKLDEVRFEFLCYADSYNAAADLGVAVRAALDRVSGTYNGVNVESVQFNDVDVNIEYDPRRYSQVLTFTFRIKRDDFTIAQGTPVTGAVLGDLSDVDVTGVTNGQLIAYNSTSGNWEAANDAGGANELSDLSDANVSLPSDGEVLIYSGGEFVNDNIAISNVTGLQTALDAAPDNLRELTDVTISGLADNDYLQYDSASGKWQNSTLILGRNGEQYTGNYDSEAETLLDGATETVELYYTAQADGDGLHEDAQTDTATTGFDIRRKLYYAEKAQADPNTSGDWTQFADIADDTTYASAKATLLAYLKQRTGGTVPISLKMTWEEVAEAPSFTGLLNESYGSGAAAAYSVRRLNGNYTGAAIQVERSSDNTTQDIGFDSNGDLDESALSTFCSGTVCKVRTWYGQEASGGTGSGNDAVQTTHANQPTIYTGGAIVKENGRVAIEFTSNTNILQSSNATEFNSVLQNELYCVASYGTINVGNQYAGGVQIGGSGRGIMVGTNVSGDDIRYHCDGAAFEVGTGGTIAVDTQILHGGTYNGTTRHARLNGASVGTNTDAGTTGTADVYFIGKHPSLTAGADKKVQELILYPTYGGNESSIESNIGDYFTQNTPLLDTYTGAAAAYSLRKLRTAYTGSAIRVRRSNDNAETDIGFNVFGELDTVSLAAHCGSNDGFVKTWYDQSGNANDATQTTAANQPKIYDGTTGVVTDNGKPAIEFDDDGFTAITGSKSDLLFHTSSEGILFNVGNLDANSAKLQLIASTNGTSSSKQGFTFAVDDRSSQGSNDYGYYQVSTIGSMLSDTQGATFVGSQYLMAVHYDRASGIFQYKNGSLLDSVTGTYSYGTGDATNDLEIGNIGGNYNFSLVGKMQELIFYNADDTNRAGIETNLNTFYSIY